jgi:hypothetical protein
MEENKNETFFDDSDDIVHAALAFGGMERC